MSSGGLFIGESGNLIREIDEENLLKPDKNVEMVLNNLSEGVIIANEQGKFIYFNQVAQQILGLGRIDIPQSEWSEIYGCYYTDKTTPFPAEMLPLSIALKGIESSDTTIYVKNPFKKEGVFINISAKPIFNDIGDILGGIVVFQDVTDIRNNQVAKKQTDNRIKAQIDGFPIPTFIWQKVESDFQLIDYNSASIVFTQNSIMKLIGIKLSELYKDRPEIVSSFNECFDLKQNLNKRFSYRMVTTGDLKDIDATFVYIEPDLVLIHIIDFTPKNEVSDNSVLLSQAVEQTADCIVITDVHGTIQYVNPSFELTTGYSASEVIGQNPKIMKSGVHSKIFYVNMWKTLCSGKPFRGTIVNKRKNGEYFLCQQTISPIIDENANIVKYVSVIKDISDLAVYKK